MSDLLYNLGQRIRTFRRAARLTQEALAEKASVSPYYVGEIERGEASPSLSALQDIARGLQVGIRDLFDFPSEQGTPQQIVEDIVARLQAGHVSHIEDLILIREMIRRMSTERRR